MSSLIYAGSVFTFFICLPFTEPLWSFHAIIQLSLSDIAKKIDDAYTCIFYDYVLHLTRKTSDNV